MTEVESSMNFFDHIKELRQKLITIVNVVIGIERENVDDSNAVI